jgi:hypothetical protein
MKPLLWILAAAAAILLFVAVTGPRDHPDEQRARRDFLAEHPTFSIDHVAVDEQEVVAISYRIFYRVPGDSGLHEEFRQYLHTDGQWRISHRLQDR